MKSAAGAERFRKAAVQFHQTGTRHACAYDFTHADTVADEAVRSGLIVAAAEDAGYAMGKLHRGGNSARTSLPSAI
jgi:hypothetical protein